MSGLSIAQTTTLGGEPDALQNAMSMALFDDDLVDNNIATTTASAEPSTETELVNFTDNQTSSIVSGGEDILQTSSDCILEAVESTGEIVFSLPTQPPHVLESSSIQVHTILFDQKHCWQILYFKNNHFRPLFFFGNSLTF